eukprot:2935-Heterococcus_DN1.PRE.1
MRALQHKKPLKRALSKGWPSDPEFALDHDEQSRRTGCWPHTHAGWCTMLKVQSSAADEAAFLCIHQDLS